MTVSSESHDRKRRMVAVLVTGTVVVLASAAMWSVDHWSLRWLTNLGQYLGFEHGRIPRFVLQRSFGGLALAGFALGVVRLCWRGMPTRAWFVSLLTLAAVSLCLMMCRSNLHQGRSYDSGDNFLYVLGAKYFSELGHARFNRCASVAIRDMSRKPPPRFRNLETNRIVNSKRFLTKKRRKQCRRRFSAKRWEEFQKDIRFFRAANTRSHWNHKFKDHGYNGSPIWNVFSQLGTKNAPIDANTLSTAALLNAFVLGAAFCLVILSFGWEAGLLFVLLYAVNPLEQNSLADGYMRVSWIVALLVGLCGLRRAWWGVAGGALALSAGLVVFPIFFLVAGALWMALESIQARAVSGASRRFVAGALVVAVPIALFSLGQGTGLSGWFSFFHQMSLNAGRHSFDRTGFDLAFMWPREVFRGDEIDVSLRLRLEGFHGTTWGRALQLSIIAFGTGAVIRHRATMEPALFVVTIGFMWFFGLFSSVGYYYAGFLGLPLVLATDTAPSSRRSVLLLLVVCAVVGLSWGVWHHGFVRNTVFVGTFSVMLMAFCLHRAKVFGAWLARPTEPPRGAV